MNLADDPKSTGFRGDSKDDSPLGRNSGEEKKQGRKRRRTEEKKEIISVTMSQSFVDRIDELVKVRAGRSRAQLIEDAVRWFLDFSVHKWSERGIYVNSCRVALESDTLSSLFFAKLTPTEQYELGITAGTQAPVADVVTLFHGRNPRDESNRALVLKLLQDNGWGAVSYHDDLIVFGSPFYPASFIKGYLESLLRVDLEVVETSVKENAAFRVVKKGSRGTHTD
jgi:Arc/MetJ-type ribon-helix-helix transcriptional regulator